MVLTVTKAKETLDTVINNIQNIYEPITIAGDSCSAVLVSEEVWRSIEETMYLYSIPGMKESIIAGINEKIEDCVPLEKVWPDV
jgi:PHD/YefM family antitoxin component YafN of YafNO toxin-antitoxin module